MLPYGTTPFQAMNAAINAVAKRYRFSGKERDEESGLYYHGARYYAPWLGRWTAVDALEAEYAPWSPYNYGLCNPLTYTDPSGMAAVSVEEKKKEQPITYTKSAEGNIQGEIGEVTIPSKPKQAPSFWQRLGSGLKRFGEGLLEGVKDAVVETVKFAVNVFRPDEQNSLWQIGKALHQMVSDPVGTARAVVSMVQNTNWKDPKTYGKLAGNLLVNVAGPGLVAKGIKAIGEAAQLSQAVKATEELVNLGRADEVVTAGAAGAAGVGQGASTSAGARFIVTEGGTTIIEDAAVLEKTLNNANFPKFTTQGQGIGYELPNGVQVRIMQPSGPNPLRASFNLPNGTKVTPEGLIPQPPRGLSPAMRKQWLNERTHINLK